MKEEETEEEAGGNRENIVPLYMMSLYEIVFMKPISMSSEYTPKA